MGNLAGILADAKEPAAQLTVMVHSADPSLCSHLFLSVLLCFKALHLENDLHLPAIGTSPANQIVRSVLVLAALPLVRNREVQMIVPDVSDDLRHPFQL